MHTFRHAMAGVVAFLAALVLYPIVALSDERLELGFEWNDDGSCTESTQSLTLTYLHESDAIDKVYGRIRQAPSGGNCLKESTTGTLEVEKRFPLTHGTRIEWQALVKFLADVRSFSGIYKPEGADPNAGGTSLRAGGLDTGSGVVGAGAEIGRWDVALGFNVEPVCWSDGTCERTLHMALGTEFQLLGGALEVAVDMDTDGTHRYGSARTVWRQSVENTVLGLTVGLYYDYGLRAIMPDAPMTQEFAGVTWYLDGPGADTATRLGIDLAFAI